MAPTPSWLVSAVEEHDKIYSENIGRGTHCEKRDDRLQLLEVGTVGPSIWLYMSDGRFSIDCQITQTVRKALEGHTNKSLAALKHHYFTVERFEFIYERPEYSRVDERPSYAVCLRLHNLAYTSKGSAPGLNPKHVRANPTVEKWMAKVESKILHDRDLEVNSRKRVRSSDIDDVGMVRGGRDVRETGRVVDPSREVRAQERGAEAVVANTVWPSYTDKPSRLVVKTTSTGRHQTPRFITSVPGTLTAESGAQRNVASTSTSKPIQVFTAVPQASTSVAPAEKPAPPLRFYTEVPASQIAPVRPKKTGPSLAFITSLSPPPREATEPLRRNATDGGGEGESAEQDVKMEEDSEHSIPWSSSPSRGDSRDSGKSSPFAEDESPPPLNQNSSNSHQEDASVSTGDQSGSVDPNSLSTTCSLPPAAQRGLSPPRIKDLVTSHPSSETLAPTTQPVVSQFPSQPMARQAYKQRLNATRSSGAGMHTLDDSDVNSPSPQRSPISCTSSSPVHDSSAARQSTIAPAREDDLSSSPTSPNPPSSRPFPIVSQDRDRLSRRPSSIVESRSPQARPAAVAATESDPFGSNGSGVDVVVPGGWQSSSQSPSNRLPAEDEAVAGTSPASSRSPNKAPRPLLGLETLWDLQGSQIMNLELDDLQLLPATQAHVTPVDKDDALLNQYVQWPEEDGGPQSDEKEIEDGMPGVEVAAQPVPLNSNPTRHSIDPSFPSRSIPVPAASKRPRVDNLTTSPSSSPSSHRQVVAPTRQSKTPRLAKASCPSLRDTTLTLAQWSKAQGFELLLSRWCGPVESAMQQRRDGL